MTTLRVVADDVPVSFFGYPGAPVPFVDGRSVDRRIIHRGIHTAIIQKMFDGMDVACWRSCSLWSAN
jgi:hypothetical protein